MQIIYFGILNKININRENKLTLINETNNRNYVRRQKKSNFPIKKYRNDDVMSSNDLYDLDELIHNILGDRSKHTSDYHENNIRISEYDDDITLDINNQD